MAGDNHQNLTLWDYLLVFTRQWTIVVVSVALAWGWAYWDYKPAQPRYSKEVAIRVIPPKSRDVFFKDVTNVLGRERSLEAQEEFLKSNEFLTLVAQQAVIEQMAKARTVGGSAIWNNLDVSLEAAKNVVKDFDIVRNDISQTISLRFSGPSRDQVAVISELVPRMFSQLNKSRVNRKYGEIRNFIRHKLRDFQDREKDLMQSIWTLRGSTNAYSLGEDALRITENTLADVRLKKDLTKASLQEYKEQLDRIKNENVGELDYTEQLVQRLQTKLVDLEYQKALLLRDYTESHPEVQSVSEEIALTRRSLNQKLSSMMKDKPTDVSPLDWYRLQVDETFKLEVELGTLERREHALEDALDDSIQEARAITSFQQELARLESELNLFRELRRSFYNKLVDLDLSIEMDREEGGYAEVVQGISLPPTPQSVPGPWGHYLVWTFFGLLVGIVFAYFLDYNDTSIKSEMDVRRWLGLPLLSSIPTLREIRKKTFREIMPEFEMGRQTMESFRTLRTQVEFKGIDKPLKTLLVTSTRPSEGKTAIMTNLAVTFAQKGEQTLLVDCDLRRPSLHRHLDLNRSPGLSNILMGDLPWRQALQETDMPNLWVLTAGDLTVNPSELLSSRQMRDLIDEFSMNYDRVLFDMSSVLAVTDSAILGSVVDGVILVVKAYKTPRSYIQQAIEIMHNVGSNMVGVVFNQVRRYGSAYYYYYYYHSEADSDSMR
ncbi:MAG: polysaccharide biosynthesis tyrosine autokinase [Candidatus Omnitrophica bacterium]|nr:polysaccharide biosynthesis tyrosine autokinase [Candidatus Omnitrophota bacterium]